MPQDPEVLPPSSSACSTAQKYRELFYFPASTGKFKEDKTRKKEQGPFNEK